MVKSPKIQHSKTGIRPVTIDLGAEDVSRIPSGQPKPEGVSDAATVQAAKSAGTTKSETSGPPKTQAAGNDAKPAKSGGAVPPVGGSTGTGPAATSTPGPAKADEARKAAETGPTATTGSSTFGRDATSKPSAPPLPSPPTTTRRSAGSIFAAGLLGGAIALAGAAGAYYGGLLPAAQAPAATGSSGATDVLRAEVESLRAEIAELRTAPATQEGDGAALGDLNARIEGVGVLVEDLRTKLAQLAERPAAGSSDTAALDELRSALSALDQRVAALPAQGGPGDEALRAEIARVADSVAGAVQAAASATEAAGSAQARIDGLEQRLGDVAIRLEEQEKTPGVALAISASALKAAIDRGTPFTTELETYAGLAPDAPEITALRELASSGVPTRAAIAAETDAAAVRMIEAGRVIDPQAGLLDRLWASAQSLVTVRPVGHVEGGDVPAIVARWEAAIEAGDFDAAIAEYETLPADAKAAGAPLMDKVRARQSADRLVDQTLSAALRA